MMDWSEPHLNSTPMAVSAFVLVGTSSAAASAEICMIPAGQYGVPPGVHPEQVFRFSRVKATPRGEGGGSLVLAAALAETDRRGLWTVLEAGPYPGQDQDALYVFYEKHGFQRESTDNNLMYRPPG